jgi:hypothetical protein
VEQSQSRTYELGKKNLERKLGKRGHLYGALCRIEFLLKSLASYKHMHSKTRSHVE